MSTSVSQLLQVTAPRSEGKIQQADSSPEGQFQKLLDRAAGSSEKRPQDASDSKDTPESNEALTDDADRDGTAVEYPETSLPSDSAAPVSETEEHSEAVEEDQLDLSQTALLVSETQIPFEDPLATEAESDAAFNSNVIDASATEPISTPSEGELAVSTNQLAKTSEVDAVPIQAGELSENLGSATAEVLPDDGKVDAIHESQEHEPQEDVTHPTERSEYQQPTESSEADLIKTAEKPGTDVESTEIKVAQQSLTSPRDDVANQVTSEKTVVSQEIAIEVETAPEDSHENASPIETKVPDRRDSETAKLDAQPVTDQQVNTDKEPVAVSHGTRLPNAILQPGQEAAASPLRSAAGVEGDGAAAQASDDAEVVSTQDRARFVQRVSRAFQSAQTRNGQIQLRLSPPELGSLRISINMQQGVVSAMVETETPAARNILLDNLPALRERLAEQEVRVEKFDVDVRREGGQETGNQGTADRQPRRPPANDPQSRPRETTASELPTDAPTAETPQTVADGSLDVRI